MFKMLMHIVLFTIQAEILGLLVLPIMGEY